MRSSRNTVAQRCGSAWRDLRGRPAEPDYGVLIVLPFLAAAVGAFLGLTLESAVRLLAMKAVPAQAADARHTAADPAEQNPSTLRTDRRSSTASEESRCPGDRHPR